MEKLYHLTQVGGLLLGGGGGEEVCCFVEAIRESKKRPPISYQRPSETYLGSPVTVTSRGHSLQILPELLLGKLKTKEKMRTDRRYSS